jgi:hypothetical protein
MPGGAEKNGKGSYSGYVSGPTFEPGTSRMRNSSVYHSATALGEILSSVHTTIMLYRRPAATTSQAVPGSSASATLQKRSDLNLAERWSNTDGRWVCFALHHHHATRGSETHDCLSTRHCCRPVKKSLQFCTGVKLGLSPREKSIYIGVLWKTVFRKISGPRHGDWPIRANIMRCQVTQETVVHRKARQAREGRGGGAL